MPKTKNSSLFRLIINGTLWSFVGVVLTVAFFYWSEQRNPYRFTILLDDVQNLVEVRERISDLQILYRDQDILELKKNIKIARITLKNDGATLLQQHYDDLQEFGLRVGDATILDVELSDTNSDYLKKHLLPEWKRQSPDTNGDKKQIEENFIRFKKVIFEGGKYATIRVYLLQNQDSDLKIEAIGKIANIDLLRISKSHKDKKLVGFSIPLLSFLTAYFGIIAGMLSLVFVMIGWESWSKKRKIRVFIKNHKEMSSTEQEIIDLYQDRWDSSLNKLLRMCAGSQQVINLRTQLSEEIDRLSNRLIKFPFLLTTPKPSSIRRLLSPQYLPEEIFSCDGNRLQLNKTNKSFIIKFFCEVGVLKSDIINSEEKYNISDKTCNTEKTAADNNGDRDREEPHDSPLPHHAAYGSVLRGSADPRQDQIQGNKRPCDEK